MDLDIWPCLYNLVAGSIQCVYVIVNLVNKGNNKITELRNNIVLLCDVFHIGLVMGPRPAVLA